MPNNETKVDPTLALMEALKGKDVGLLAPKTFDFLANLTSKMEPNVLTPITGMHFLEQTKYVTYDIPEEKFPKNLELLQITDVQFGHRECKYQRVVEYRDWVLKEPNRFMFWTGDNVDAWAMWSPGTPWEQLLNPMGQVMRFVEMWAPARHRILGYVGGNHERRAIPGFGDCGTLIASLLNIPYSGGRQLIDINYGKWAPFKTTLWHGVGGARTKGTVAQVLDRFMQLGDSDLYLMGHLHKALVMPDFKEVRHPKSRKIQVRKSMGAVGTSFLETWGTYGEVAGFNSSDVVMARAVLEPSGKWELTLR